METTTKEKTEEKLEEKKEKYEEKLINKIKIESMHKRYQNNFLYLKNFRDMFQLYQESCNEFSKKLSSINSKFISDNKTNIYLKSINEVCFEVFNYLLKQSEIYRNLFASLNELITSIPKDQKYMYLEKNEKDLYNKSKNCNKEYDNSKINFIKVKNEYNNNFTNLEKAYRDLDENKIDKNDRNKHDIKIKKLIDTIKNLHNKYIVATQDINKKKEEKIKNEKALLSLYQNVDNQMLNQIKDVIGKFAGLIKGISEEDMKLLRSLFQKHEEINITKDINNYINEFKNKECEEENFKFEPYIPQAKLISDKICADEKEAQTLNSNYRIISFLKKDFNDICQGIDMEKEKQKYTLRVKTQKLFNLQKDSKLPPEELEKLKNNLTSLLKVEDNRKYMIIALSNQRTKNRFNRSRELIEILGLILKQILDYSEKEKNYENAKHCIIISQTFYYEDEKTKKKIYLFEYIKNNKWLKSIKFWDEITNYMIQQDIENNDRILGKEALKKETQQQRRDRKSQVGLSQLLTFSENMIDFKLKKSQIFQIINRKVENFEITDSFKTLIIEHINSTWEDRKKDDLFFDKEDIPNLNKIRNNSVKFLKQIKINNNVIFNQEKAKKENEENKDKPKKKLERARSFESYRIKILLERRTILDTIKKEMNLDKEISVKKKLFSSVMPKKQNLEKPNLVPMKSKSGDNKAEDDVVVIDKNEIKEENENEEEDQKEDKKEEQKNEIKDETQQENKK